jgi:hypothetical protein
METSKKRPICAVSPARRSPEAKQKYAKKQKERRDDLSKFIKMLQQEFPDAEITSANFHKFLFQLAGYSFDPTTFTVTDKPCKVAGGHWSSSPTVPTVPTVPPIQTTKTSLLENKRFVEFVHKPVCDLCGGYWSCEQTATAFKSTNGCFKLTCASCGFEKFWSTQGDDLFLDNLLWVSCKLTGAPLTKVGHILRLLGIGYDSKQHQAGRVFKSQVVPTIHQQYLEVREKVMKETKEACDKQKCGLTITWDGGYSSRNNNSDHAIVSFVEHVTGKNLLLHLEMGLCSKEMTPQAAEGKLIVAGYKAIKSILPVDRVGHDGKQVTDATKIDPAVQEDLDPWHFQKGEVKHFKAHCTAATLCVKGNKDKGISGDTKEVQMVKMTRRKHLLGQKSGIKFHLIRCLKCSKLSTHIFWMLWSGYLLHCYGDHRFCVDEDGGFESMGKSTCAIQKNPAKLFDNEEGEILRSYLFNERIGKALPRLLHMTSSSVNESIWNVMGIYRDKTVHYKYYDTLYEMGYLDWNENRDRNVHYTYSSEVREWKTKHPKRTNRTILDGKSYKWQAETLRRIFPKQKEWFDSQFL